MEVKSRLKLTCSKIELVNSDGDATYVQFPGSLTAVSYAGCVPYTISTNEGDKDSFFVGNKDFCNVYAKIDVLCGGRIVFGKICSSSGTTEDLYINSRGISGQEVFSINSCRLDVCSPLCLNGLLYVNGSAFFDGCEAEFNVKSVKFTCGFHSTSIDVGYCTEGLTSNSCQTKLFTKKVDFYPEWGGCSDSAKDMNVSFTGRESDNLASDNQYKYSYVNVNFNDYTNVNFNKGSQATFSCNVSFDNESSVKFDNSGAIGYRSVTFTTPPAITNYSSVTDQDQVATKCYVDNKCAPGLDYSGSMGSSIKTKGDAYIQFSDSTIGTNLNICGCGDFGEISAPSGNLYFKSKNNVYFCSPIVVTSGCSCSNSTVEMLNNQLKFSSSCCDVDLLFENDKYISIKGDFKVHSCLLVGCSTVLNCSLDVKYANSSIFSNSEYWMTFGCTPKVLDYDGLVDVEEGHLVTKYYLDQRLPQSYTYTSPSLTSTNGVITWEISLTDNLINVLPFVQVWDDEGKVVECDIAFEEANKKVTLVFNGISGFSAGKFTARILNV